MEKQFSIEDVKGVLSAASKATGQKLDVKVDENTGNISLYQNEAGVTKQVNVADLPIQALNEFFSDIDNKLVSVDVVDGLSLESELAIYNILKDTQAWVNGSIEKVGVNTKGAKRGYTKKTTYDGVYNPTDHEDELSIGTDAFKVESSALFDEEIISRALANAAQFNSFYSTHVKKIRDDIASAFIDDARNNLQVILPGLAVQVVVPVNTDPNLVTNDIYQAVVNTIKKQQFKSSDYTSNGWDAANGPGETVVIWNIDTLTKIQFQNAQSFQPQWYRDAITKYNVTELELPLGEDNLVYVMNRKALTWNVTMNKSGSINRDAFSFVIQKRYWYGFVFLPWMNAASIILEPATPPAILEAKTKSLKAIIKGIKENVNGVDSQRLGYYNTMLKAFNAKAKLFEEVKKETKK